MSYSQFERDRAEFRKMGGHAEYYRVDTPTWVAEAEKLCAILTAEKRPTEVRVYDAMNSGVLTRWTCAFAKSDDGSWSYIGGFNVIFPCPPFCTKNA